MDTTKSIFRSKTFWGSAVAILATLAGFLGIEITAADQAELVGLFDHALAAWDRIIVVAGAVIAIYGRVTARVRIG